MGLCRKVVLWKGGKRWWAVGKDQCPPAGHWRGAGVRGGGTGAVERGICKALHSSLSTQVSEC